jgi:hypothetical protein
MFNAWSATIRFSRRFSSSSALRRWSSTLPNPLYFRFHRQNVSNEIPCRRMISRAVTPP